MSANDITAVKRHRQHVLIILAADLGILLGLILLWLVPLRAELAGVQDGIRRTESELAVSRARYARQPLRAHLAQAQRTHQRLRREWEDLRVRVNTFRGKPTLLQTLPTYEDGRIDFKVTLFTARTNLNEGASRRGVSLPEDLGVPETIGSEEKAETRLWQLASTVKLIEQVMEAGIPVVERIQSAPPVSYPLLEEENAVAVEFPVSVTMRCAFDKVPTFLKTILTKGRFFALRRFRLELRERKDGAPLTATVVCSSLLFQLRAEGDGAIPSTGARPKAKPAQAVPTREGAP